MLAAAVASAVAYLVFFLLADKALPWCVPHAERLIGAPSFFGEMPVQMRNVVALYAALSLTLLFAGGPALGVYIALGDADTLILCWATVMLEFKAVGRWYVGEDPDWWRVVLFSFMVGAAFFKGWGAAVEFIAVLAGGSVLRFFDHAHCALNHLFPDAGRGFVWDRFLRGNRHYQEYQEWVLFLENCGLCMLFIRAAQSEVVDMWVLVMACYMAAIYEQPEWEAYARVPPPVLRDGDGRLALDIYHKPRAAIKDLPPSEPLPPVVESEIPSREEGPAECS